MPPKLGLIFLAEFSGEQIVQPGEDGAANTAINESPDSPNERTDGVQPPESGALSRFGPNGATDRVKGKGENRPSRVSLGQRF